jgi:hypothetical protein
VSQVFSRNRKSGCLIFSKQLRDKLLCQCLERLYYQSLCDFSSSPLLYSAAMAKEGEGAGIPFTDIHINLADQTITLKKEEEVVATLVFAGKLPASGVIFFGNQKPALEDSPFTEDAETPVSPTSPAKEKEKPITLSGKLKSLPKPGKPDRSGKPTAFADFAAHVDGEDKAHDFVATFHRHTRDIAAKLSTEAQITVTGYPHPSNTPKRKDTFSVVNIVEYPGKPPARRKTR